MTNKPSEPSVSPAQALDLLIARWRSQADEYERRKTEAMNQRYEPGEMINRSKMLAFRNCADELQSVLAELRLRAPSRATPEEQKETPREILRRERRAVALTALDHLLTVAVKPFAGDRHSQQDLSDSAKCVSTLIGEFESEVNEAERLASRATPEEGCPDNLGGGPHSCVYCGDFLPCVSPALGWQDISTAPTAERVLVFVPDDEHCIDGVFTATRIGLTKRWVLSGGGGPLPIQPTHWQALPASPASAVSPTEEA